MDEDVLFEEAEHSDQSSTSIEVVTERQPTGHSDLQDVPQIDGQGIYDFEIDNMEEKPWEKPGADITDYFNYGFNEHTWKKYCAAQREFVKGMGSAGKKSRGEKHARRREDRERYGAKGDRKGRAKEEHAYDEKDAEMRRDERARRSRGKRSGGRDKRHNPAAQNRSCAKLCRNYPHAQKVSPMRILITSDNHLGYKERDPVLSMDSFTTFEEVLCIANARNVDLIIQGGDLFHENRPSRFTLAQAISCIKKYTFGNRDLSLCCNRRLNYEDPNINVAIPIIAIHGNHDDPTGAFSTSALDILSSFNLINYLGQTQNVDFIEIEPLVFNGEVALYLLGNVRDRRLYRTFLQKKVSFLRPEGCHYNILVVHQNRVPHSAKDYLPHEFIPSWFDLVVYGHEHESLVLNLKDFVLLQPGSTVRTSLAENESFDKFVYIFDSVPRSIERVELQTVRPFLMRTLELDMGDVETYLREQVEVMLSLLEKEEGIKRRHVDEKSQSVHERRIREMLECMNRAPLVRIRGKLKTQGLVNNHKFGLSFDGRVANTGDMLKLTRERTRRPREVHRNTVSEKTEFLDIVRSHLNFKALSEERFAGAISDFIAKDDKNSFSQLFSTTIEHIVERLWDKGTDDLEKRIIEIKNEVNACEEAAGNFSDVIDDRCAFTNML
ncbi:UNVERIFIED_CONTAM: hypothetical protein PYX00_011345 [Menopon gallinae]|uniref:Mre11 DNA-binding domain-containing protein n=1 Tax=Menopon gallinae TaxID=328185 RepID=A0AAW2H7K9_9NEOP